MHNASKMNEGAKSFDETKYTSFLIKNDEFMGQKVFLGNFSSTRC